MNEFSLQQAVLFLIPVASVIGIFTLLSVVGYARERRREREALYRHETARKLVEHGQMNFEQFAAFERAEAERPLAARRRALSLAGAVLAIGGLAMWVAFKTVPEEAAPGLRDLAVLGFIPLLVGGAVFLHVASTEMRKKAD
jgi:hypothetical protein